jgi:uroporphyrinogen-III synthase
MPQFAFIAAPVLCCNVFYIRNLRISQQRFNENMKPISPLYNKTILVTRPGVAGEELAAKLETAGAKAVVMPMIEITEPDSWQALDEAIKNIDSYHWLFFASSNAIISFTERPQSMFPLPKIAVIGEATANVAREKALKVNYCPEAYVAENFVEKFPGYPDLSGVRILWPRTNVGRDLITEKLQAAGAIVHEVPAYKTILPRNAKDLSAQLNQLIVNKELDAITLASTETAKNLGQIISANLSLLQDVLIVTIGPQTAEGALNYLGKESLQANPHTNEGMLAKLIEYYQNADKNN